MLECLTLVVKVSTQEMTMQASISSQIMIGPSNFKSGMQPMETKDCSLCQGLQEMVRVGLISIASSRRWLIHCSKTIRHSRARDRDSILSSLDMFSESCMMIRGRCTLSDVQIARGRSTKKGWVSSDVITATKTFPTLKWESHTLLLPSFQIQAILHIFL